MKNMQKLIYNILGCVTPNILQPTLNGHAEKDLKKPTILQHLGLQTSHKPDTQL